jgi:hypothetical protein
MSFLIAAMLVTTLAQVMAPDTTLRLKNGEEVHGVLVEIKNGAYVLALPDGRTVLYPTDDVVSAERIGAAPPANSPTGATGAALLAPGRRVYVKSVTNNDIHETLANLLREWGRWKVLDTADDADILVRLHLSGSEGWGRASIVAVIEDAHRGDEIWRSKKQTGTRTIFHGYEAPYRRAANGILEQMKEASATWPR